MPDAIASHELDGTEKLELGSALTGDAFFKRSDKSGGANPIVVTALAQGLVKATDAEERLDWVRFLASCVLGTLSDKSAKDRTIRTALVRKCPSPLSAQVHVALTALTHQSQGDEQKLVRELLDAWGAAGTAP